MARSKRQKMTRILVVEDSTDDQELLLRQLRKADWPITFVSSVMGLRLGNF